MALTGPNYARTTLQTTSSRLLESLSRQNRAMTQAGEQLATGRRLLSLASDPLAATGWLGTQSALTRNTVYGRQAHALTQHYQFTDSQLGEAADILTQMKSIALRESNATADAATRAAGLTEVNQLRSALLQIANSSFAGRNLFGGSLLQGSAFAMAGGAVRYSGTAGVNQLAIGPGISMEQGLGAATAWGALTNTITGRVDLNARATLATTSPPTAPPRTTSLAALNNGAGVDTAGRVIIEVRPDPTQPAQQFAVSLSGAQTLEDVLVALNNVRGSNGAQMFNADLVDAAARGYPQDDTNRASAIRLRAHPAGPLAALGANATIRISDVAGHTTARDLGLLTHSTALTAQSEDLSALLPTTAPMNFNLRVNGAVLPITATPLAPGGVTQIAAALDAAIDSALVGAGIAQVNVNVTASGNALRLDVTDTGSGGYFELEALNAAARDLRLGKATGSVTATHGTVAFAVATGVVCGDLNPALDMHVRLADLFGGAGLALAPDATGNPRAPQGLVIENGPFRAELNLLPLLQRPDATLDDLRKLIDGSGAEVELRVSGNALQLTSRASGTSLAVRDLNGTLASQLGLSTSVSDARASDLNGGLGLGGIDGTDFSLTTRDGRNMAIDISGAVSARGIAEAINAAPDNAAPQIFEAQVYRERTFDALPHPSPLLGLNFNVSFNGGEPEWVMVNASPARTWDELAQDISDAMNAAARRSGLDGYSVDVRADATTGVFNFRVEDTNGIAHVAFFGGTSGFLGLSGAGQNALINEASADRLAIRDLSFNPATHQSGDPTPDIAAALGASVLTDLGLGAFDTTTGRFVSADLRLAGRHDDSVFGAVNALAEALRRDDTAAIGRSIDRVQGALQHVLDARGETGGRLQRLEMASLRIENENASLESLASHHMDADLAQAAQQLTAAQVALNAGLAATAQIGRLSLFDYL